MLGESNFSLFYLICFCIIIINLDFFVSSGDDTSGVDIEAQFIYEYSYRERHKSSNSFWSMICSCLCLCSRGISEPICKLSDQDKEKICQVAATSLSSTLDNTTKQNFKCTKKTITYRGENHKENDNIERNMYKCSLVNNEDIYVSQSYGTSKFIYIFKGVNKTYVNISSKFEYNKWPQQ